HGDQRVEVGAHVVHRLHDARVDAGGQHGDAGIDQRWHGLHRAGNVDPTRAVLAYRQLPADAELRCVAAGRAERVAHQLAALAQLVGREVPQRVPAVAQGGDAAGERLAGLGAEPDRHPRLYWPGRAPDALERDG